MNTIENNKLIAEFMGIEIVRGDGLTPHGYVRFDTIELGKGPIAKYHTSWDWLMPVVEKIGETSPYNTSLMINHVTIHDNIHRIYDAVIEFIKWYNENKEA